MMHDPRFDPPILYVTKDVLEEMEKEISKRRFVLGMDLAEDKDSEYSVKSVFDDKGELKEIILTDSKGKSITYKDDKTKDY